VEIMIVIIIIGLIAALVAPKFFGKLTIAKQKAAKVQIGHFEAAVDAFRLDVGRYPTSEEGLKALREKPSGADNWQGPYLPKEIPLDPWGAPYVYKSLGKKRNMKLSPTDSTRPSGGTGENEDIVS
jgi:general secretion pathway protein G